MVDCSHPGCIYARRRRRYKIFYLKVSDGKGAATADRIFCHTAVATPVANEKPPLSNKGGYPFCGRYEWRRLVRLTPEKGRNIKQVIICRRHLAVGLRFWIETGNFLLGNPT